VTGVKSLAELVAHLKKPRKLIILVQAGKPVDETINAVASLMEDGDCIIDGGNEWFLNSTRRSEFLAKKHINFIAMGISGVSDSKICVLSLFPPCFDLFLMLYFNCVYRAKRVLDMALL
jgi:6-phosphogluconate dehydrogenase